MAVYFYMESVNQPNIVCLPDFFTATESDTLTTDQEQQSETASLEDETAFSTEQLISTDILSAIDEGNSSRMETTSPHFKRCIPAVACTIEVYDRKFTIVDYASVWSITYNRNL